MGPPGILHIETEKRTDAKEVTQTSAGLLLVGGACSIKGIHRKHLGKRLPSMQNGQAVSSNLFSC